MVDSEAEEGSLGLLTGKPGTFLLVMTTRVQPYCASCARPDRRQFIVWVLLAVMLSWRRALAVSSRATRARPLGMAGRANLSHLAGATPAETSTCPRLRPHLRLRGGSKHPAEHRTSDEGNERLGPFMADSEEEQALRAELGVGALDEETFAEVVCAAEGAGSANSMDTGRQHGALLSPDYLSAAAARSKPRVCEVRSGNRTDLAASAGGDEESELAGLHLFTLSNGLTLNFKLLQASPHDVGADEAETGPATDGVPDTPGLSIRIVFHGGVTLFDDPPPHPAAISAALSTWVGGGMWPEAADEGPSAVQRHMREHKIKVSAACETEKAVVDFECETDSLPRVFECIHWLVVSPRFSGHVLAQVRLVSRIVPNAHSPGVPVMRGCEAMLMAADTCRAGAIGRGGEAAEARWSARTRDRCRGLARALERCTLPRPGRSWPRCQWSDGGGGARHGAALVARECGGGARRG